jgi:DNA polymerase III epsilon subunit-like protein
MYLFIDCETTGLPRNWRAPVTDLQNWPRTVQIAWAEFDGNDRHIGTKCYVVKPVGFTIPRDAQRVHGISTAHARSFGKPARTVLKALDAAAKKARVIVAHNLGFDEAVITAEFLRLGLEPPFDGKKRVCTMQQTTEFCGLPGPRGFKWPKLQELHEILFGVEPINSHDAKADALACAKCFFKLKKMRIIRVGRVGT